MAPPEPPPSVFEPVPAGELIEYAKMILKKAPSTTVAQLHGMLLRKFNNSLMDETLISLANEARAARVTGPQPVVAPAISANDLEGAVRLILETIPNLKSFKIDVDETGEVSVSHTTREVRVVESSGSMKLRKPGTP